MLVLAIVAYAFVRLASRLPSVKSKQLKWWQKLAALVALLFVIMIAANPEFWALGLLSDTAFVDVFVLLMSIQLQMIVFWAWDRLGPFVFQGWRWLLTPSPRMSYLWAACIVAAILNLILAVCKSLRRAVPGSGIRPGNLCA